MSEATIIDGAKTGEDLRAMIAAQVAKIKGETGITPGLAVVLVGEDPASQVYVRTKHKRTEECGMNSFEHVLPASASEDEILSVLAKLNADPAVHGILVQLPLPAHINEQKIIEAIDPAKDVDGFHPINVGRLTSGIDALIPCTPYGCLYLLKKTLPKLEGLSAIVIGRSNIVGKPMAALLLKESATVTIAHSRTKNLADECRRADILVAAVGRPNMIKGDWIKPGATVIDVGINRVPAENGKTRLVGDVDFAEAVKVAGAITPVPGGVGPMTIAMLMKNTLEAYCRQNGLAVPELL